MIPDRCPRDSEPETCDLVAAFREAREEACDRARPPAAGLVWWRAERRYREEAARKAAVPISFVHGLALGCAAAAAVAVLDLGVATVRDGFAQWCSPFQWPSTAVPAGVLIGSLSALPLGVLVLLVATLLLAPVAAYLALSEK